MIQLKKQNKNYSSDMQNYINDYNTIIKTYDVDFDNLDLDHKMLQLYNKDILLIPYLEMKIANELKTININKKEEKNDLFIKEKLKQLINQNQATIDRLNDSSKNKKSKLLKEIKTLNLNINKITSKIFVNSNYLASLQIRMMSFVKTKYVIQSAHYIKWNNLIPIKQETQQRKIKI